MMRPKRWLIIAGKAALVVLKVPFRLTSITPLPILAGHLAQRMVPGNAGVVHQDVEALPLVEHLIDDPLGFAPLGDVALNHHAPDTQIADLLGDRLGIACIGAEVDGNRGALTVRQLQSDGAADAARSSSDQRHPSGEGKLLRPPSSSSHTRGWASQFTTAGSSRKTT